MILVSSNFTSISRIDLTTIRVLFQVFVDFSVVSNFPAYNCQPMTQTVVDKIGLAIQTSFWEKYRDSKLRCVAMDERDEK